MKSNNEIVEILSSSHKKYLSSIEKARESFTDPILTADDVYVMKVIAKEHDEYPIISGVDFWDELVGPFRRGNLYVLAGFAGCGKSTMALQLAWNVARQGRNVLFYCLELVPTEVLEMLVGHIRSNAEPTEEDYVYACTLAHKSGFRFFDSTVYRKWDEHLKIIAAGTRKHNIEMVVIDNFHYLTRVDRDATGVEGVVSQRLKGLSQELNIPVMLIHHLRKPDSDGLEPEPTVHALRGSSALLNDASAVVLLHHPLVSSDTESDGERQQVGKLRYGKARWGKGGSKFVRLIGHKRMYESASSMDYARETKGSKRVSFNRKGGANE
jgi:replicative DNA helicase